jgi:hypothetical protein
MRTKMSKMTVLAVLFLAAVGFVIFNGHDRSVMASSEQVITAKVVNLKPAPTFNGIAYIAGHGGHLAIVDLRTMKSPTDIEKDRIVLTEAGSEMEGKIAGMTFEQIKKAGGSHGQALVHEHGDKVLVAGTLNGDVYKVDLRTGKKEGPFKVGEKFCGAIAGPDGKIYFEDMADGHVYVWDANKLKTVDKMPAGKAVCGIQWTKNAKKAYITDMPTGTVFVYNWKTKKKIKEIKDPEGMTFIHQTRMSPDGKYLWVSAPNEFDPGLKPPTHKSQVVIIDTKTDTVAKRIILPDNIRPHDFAFAPGGKYVLMASRTYGDDSKLVVMDRHNYNIVEEISTCKSCHSKYGIEVKIDKGSPLLCGIEVDWHPGKK